MTFEKAPMRRIWLLIFFAAVAVRLLNLAILPTDPAALLREDASLYWTGAAVFIEHGSFSREFGDTLVPHTERVPGYMLFLAAIRAIFGNSLIAALVIQALVDALTCVLTAWMAAQLSPKLALPAGILAALWPNLVVHSGTILSDSLFLMLFTAMLAAACRFLQAGAVRWTAAAGLALGLATLTRPVSQLLPLLMAPAAFIVPIQHRRGLGAAVLATILFLACTVAPLAPLLHRNYTQFGTLALTSQSGAHLIGWVVPLVRRAADGTPRAEGAAALSAKVNALRTADGGHPDDLDPFARSRLYSQVGFEALGRYPFSAIATAWTTGAAINLAAPAVAIDGRVRALPHPSFDETDGNGIVARIFNFLSRASGLYLVIMGGGLLLSVAFLALQGYGFVALARYAPWPTLLAALCIGYFLAVNGPVGSPKYRLPFEPVLIVLSALALTDLVDRIRQRSQ